MTSASAHEITCPTCFQPTLLLFKPTTQDYVILTHKTIHRFKCASTGNVYSKELVEKSFRRKR